jgi:exonuclease III
LLRIDNILVSPAIEVVSYDVDNDIKLSDHYPVISRLNLTHK